MRKANPLLCLHIHNTQSFDLEVPSQPRVFLLNSNQITVAIMLPMKRASRKKVEISLSNWVLGGDLISIVEGKQEDTRKDIREVKHRRKAFMRKPDGTYSVRLFLSPILACYILIYSIDH
jgi:hypothetical protein